MNARRVNAAAGVIHGSLVQGKRTAAGIAADLESACMLQSPESAAELEQLRARVAELEAERHVTNEALSDAAERMRADRDRITELEAELYTEQAQHRTTLEQRNAHARELLALRGSRATSYSTTPEAHAQMREGLSRYFAGKEPAQEGEHYSSVHHDYRVSRDLPEAGGAR